MFDTKRWQHLRQHPIYSRSLILLAILIAFIVGTLTYNIFPVEDAAIHAQRARDIRFLGAYSNTSYPIFHYALNLYSITASLFLDYDTHAYEVDRIGTTLIVVMSQIVAGFMIFTAFAMQSKRFLNQQLAYRFVYLTVAILVLAPIILLVVFTDDVITTIQSGTVNFIDYYAGYTFGFRPGNPIEQFFRPFALFYFFILLDIFRAKPILKWFILAPVTVLIIFVRPSYSLALIPALGLLSLIYQLRGRPINWKLLIGGVFVPTLLSLAVQFGSTFGDTTENSVGIAPFAVLTSVGLDIPTILARQLISLALPLAITLLYWSKIKSMTSLHISWLTLIIAMLYANILVENGPRFSDHNFNAPTTSAIFILNVVMLSLFIEQYFKDRKPQQHDWREIVVFGVLGLHILSSILWYIIL